MEEGNMGEILEAQMEETVSNDKLLSVNGDIASENGVAVGSLSPNDDHDQLVQTIMELRLQNEYLMSHFEGNKDFRSEGESCEKMAEGEGVKELQESVDSLNKQLSEEKQTRIAAEEALKHLQVAHSEADSKAQELSSKLIEAQQKLQQEIKERDEKYSELDTKLNRLHKRAKQRIQDVQKEKDDLELRFREASESAEKAVSQQLVLQQDLERTRQQANEALKAMDADRQQLRSSNNKLRDTIEELRHSLQPKESALEALQQSLMEKDQMLEDMQGSLQAAEEKRVASIAELSAKHQKSVESLEAQLADALSERTKATETISSLQMVVAEKESEIAEMDAASSGEAARLRASVETVRGEISNLKHEHEKERESWEATSQALRTKLEISENNFIRAEVEVAKMRSQLESEMSLQAQVLHAKDAELALSKKEINRLENEFSSYKIRAHSLLQKKDAELAGARDSEQVKALEEALREVEKEVSLAYVERDKALQDLQVALVNHGKELAVREAALSDVKQQIKGLEAMLDSANARIRSDRETWERNLRNLEEMWQSRYDALKIQNDASSREDLEKELGELKLRHKKLKEEHNSFRILSDKTIEEKENEISRLIEEIKNLNRSLESRAKTNHNGDYNTGFHKNEAYNISVAGAEQQILILARQQAQREEELTQSQRHIQALQEEIEELERENRLHNQQETMLKEELRNMDRKQKREGVDLTYLKNVIIKLLETGEVEALLPVVGMLLQFSPDEIQKCQQAYRTSMDAVPSPSGDASGATPPSLFSRFSFT